MKKSEWELRRDMCEVGRFMLDRGLVAGTDGNISIRLGEDRYLITPGGSCLGLMASGDPVVIDGRGKIQSGTGRPSSEYWMHVTAYARRPQISAVIHAHPTTTVAMTLAGVAMSQCALPEVIIAFGQVPVADYATPSTEEGAAVISDLIKRFDALVLDRHGSLTVGVSVRDALFKLEKLEHGARVMYIAHQLGGARDLPPEEIAKLAAIRESYGLGSAEDVATQCLPPGTRIPRITRGPETY